MRGSKTFLKNGYFIPCWCSDHLALHGSSCGALLFRSHHHVVPEHVVVAVAGHAGALDAPVTEQVEVTLGTMVDTLVHYCRVSSPLDLVARTKRHPGQCDPRRKYLGQSSLGQSGPRTQHGASFF